jgi:hypothetical protein
VGEVPDAQPRIDFNNDGFISTLDLTGYAAALNKTCADMGIPAWSQQ